MLASQEAGLFDKLSKVAEPSFVAVTLLETLKSLRRDGVPVERVAEKELASVFSLYSKGLVTRAAVPEIISELARAPRGVERIVRERGLEKFGEKKLRELVGAAKKKGLEEKQGIFEEIMRRHRLNVDARELKKILG